MGRPNIVSQYCIEAKDAITFLQDLPTDIHVEEVAIRALKTREWRRLYVPVEWQKYGVTFAKEGLGEVEVRGTLKKISVRDMISLIKKMIKRFHLSKEEIFVERVTLSYNGSAVKFRRQKKEIKLAHDKRKKLMVLGMQAKKGSKPDEILLKLSAKKITCKMMKTEKTIVMCTEGGEDIIAA